MSLVPTSASSRVALALWSATFVWLVLDPSPEAVRRTVLAAAMTASVWAIAYRMRPLIEAALQYAYLAGERARSEEDA